MKLLAFETATEACSVALWIDGEVSERFEVAPRRHAELSLPWAEALLADAGVARAQLDALAVSRGPGAFTGVRLGISLVQGIALALDLPVVTVSTLAVLAAGAPAAGDAERGVLASIDARMGEVYAGAFAVRGGDAIALGHEIVGAATSVELPEGHAGWHGAGTGFAAGDGALARHLAGRIGPVDATALPRAADLARLAVRAAERGELVAPERVEPAYLRNQVALTLAEQRAVRERR